MPGSGRDAPPSAAPARPNAAPKLRAVRNDVRLASKPERARVSLGRVVFMLGAVLVCAAGLLVAEGNVYEAGSDFAYWLGIVGGVMMLLQFVYSIRKHFKVARGWGSMRFWLITHVVCGIGGPLIILFHSTFGTKSLNGQIAFYTMLVVTLSGVVGRYVYVRVHHGLSGRRSTLREMQVQLEQEEDNVKPMQALAPQVVEMLKSFHVRSFASTSALGRVGRFMLMGLRVKSVRRQCKRALRPELKALGRANNWRQDQMNHHWKLACREINTYTAAVQSAAQFSAWEKLFRLWHLAHIPLLFLLVLSSVAHIVAVHMY